MRVAIFGPSILFDPEHGHAQFLCGVATELAARGCRVGLYEPEEARRAVELPAGAAAEMEAGFRAAYPLLEVTQFPTGTLDPEAALAGADLVLLLEGTEAALARRIGEERARGGTFRLLYRESRAALPGMEPTEAPEALAFCDGVLAAGRATRDYFMSRRWTPRAWAWHEAVDVRCFRPRAAGRDGATAPLDRPVRSGAAEGDLVWIGNWRDGDRAGEIQELLLEPARALGLRTRVYGVGYPKRVKASLAAAGVEYGGWLPDYRAPQVLNRFRATVFIPPRTASQSFPGASASRPFEAMACGLPLVCSPWNDSEGLFVAGADYLVARTGAGMKRQLSALLGNVDLRRSLVFHARRTVLTRHTCRHRAAELISIYDTLRRAAPPRGSGRVTARTAGAA